MNYLDVTKTDFVSNRCGNPLAPTYLVKDEDNKFVEIGLVKGSEPCVLPPPRKDPNFQHTSLNTKDIHGCQSGTKG